MSRRVLFVDDEPNVLRGFERQLRGHSRVETAVGGEAGLALLEAAGPPYAVVVSDMRMPGMDGIQFLARAKEIAPEAVRVMLTGQADQQTAIDAINEGDIFRFLTKPCPSDALIRTIEAAARQYELVTAERELLEQTLNGAVKIMMDILSMASPSAFGRATRLRRFVSELSREMPAEDAWQLELAAMLSQIGCVTLPEQTLQRVFSGEELSTAERAMFEAHPQLGAELIANIPRLEAVSDIIAYQDKRFDGTGPPQDGRRGKAIPLGARMLKVAQDFDALLLRGMTDEAARDILFERKGWYDPEVVTALDHAFAALTSHGRQKLALDALTPGMVLAEDVTTEANVLVIGRGQEVTSTLIARLQNFLTTTQMREQINVLVPQGDNEVGAA